MNICNSCLYQFDIKHCGAPNFGEVVQCECYVYKKDFYIQLDIIRHGAIKE